MDYRRRVSYLKRNHPMMAAIGRFVKWGLATVKNNILGIGGIAIAVIVILYIAGALVEAARWYLVGVASALLLLSGGLLALVYIKTMLNGFMSDQIKQLTDIRKYVADNRKDTREQVADIDKQVSGLKKDISLVKDDVSLIGYDILKEQNKLAEKVSQLESQLSNDKTADQSPNDSVE
jgi:energy-coupling factor transporter transmembrane protein EcfT